MRLKTIILLLVIMLWPTLDAQAIFDLSASPLRGGNNLRFGRISSSDQVNQEVRIRVTSTDGKQYQVFQRVVNSFLNEKNASIGADAISTYTLLGSNTSGTLYAQNIEQMSPMDQLLYSSGSGGESDSFTVAYMINGDRINTAGKFLGRIQYRVRPVGGASQRDVILNVTFETSGELKIIVEGSSTTDSVRLKFQGEHDDEGYVRVSFSGNLGQRIQIYQEIEFFPQDELFAEVSDNVVMFTTSGSTKGELSPQSPESLSRKRVLVYSSQEGEDSFVINFGLNQEVTEQQRAGFYKGKLKYIVQSGQTERVFDIHLAIKVEPVFAIDVDLPPGGLRFERLLPDSQPIIREVKVRIKTNLEKPYMIMQNVISPLTNEEGFKIPEEHFTFKGELFDDQTGRVVFADFQSVPSGENSIFFSDKIGSPSHFKVKYRLRSYPEMLPGGYTTGIRYTLGEM